MDNNRIKEKKIFNKNNHNLIMELKEKGITNKNILSAIKKTGENSFDQKELFDVKFVSLLNENIKH